MSSTTLLKGGLNKSRPWSAFNVCRHHLHRRPCPAPARASTQFSIAIRHSSFPSASPPLRLLRFRCVTSRSSGDARPITNCLFPEGSLSTRSTAVTAGQQPNSLSLSLPKSIERTRRLVESHVFRLLSSLRTTPLTEPSQLNLIAAQRRVQIGRTLIRDNWLAHPIDR